MADPKKNENGLFPRWYSWVKWGVPISLALLSGAWVGLTLTGMIPAFGTLKWAPVFFSSLEGYTAAAVLSVASAAVASLVGLATSFLVRAGLFQVTENIATQNLHRADDLENQLGELDREFKSFRAESDKALDDVIREKKEAETQYFATLGRSKHASKPSAAKEQVSQSDDKDELDAANDKEDIKPKRVPVRKKR